jgi:flavodoxin
MPDALVVYYSRSGATRQFAEAVAGRLDCDIEAIRPATPRRGAFGLLRAAADGVFRRGVDIEPMQHDPAHYQLVVLGTPVWAFGAAAPARVYLARYAESLPKVAFFAVSLALGTGRACRQLAELAEREPVAQLGLIRGKVTFGRYEEEARRFADELRQALSE